jgi:hypothetical protein
MVLLCLEIGSETGIASILPYNKLFKLRLFSPQNVPND